MRIGKLEGKKKHRKTQNKSRTEHEALGSKICRSSNVKYTTNKITGLTL